MAAAVQIDGSFGEGGGQILRSALTLSLLTGRAVQITRIRAGRKKPGLMPQHLQAVRAAAAVGSARVTGAEPGSTVLAFAPGVLQGGDYRFDIGTAGSTSLVLQTLLLPLCRAGRPSHLTVTGGTHVPWSPAFHYLERHFVPFLESIGVEVKLHLVRAGYYPRGGGEVHLQVHPAAQLSALHLIERGRLKGISCLSTVTGLPLSVAERQSRQASRRLEGLGVPVEVENLSLPGLGKGTMLLLLAQFERSRCCHYVLGAPGKPAERVADEAADELAAFLATDGAVDRYLADQLILPLALARGVSELRTERVTGHLLTNAWVVRQFLPAGIVIEGEQGRPGTIRIEGTGDP